MEREELIQIIEELHQETLYATSYLSIMQQYPTVQKQYPNAIHLSPAFNAFVYTALLESCIMDVAKLYEIKSNAIGIGYVLTHCREHIDWFPEYRKIPDSLMHSDEHIPYHRYLKPQEEHFFKNEVKIQRIFQELLNIPNSPVHVDLTFAEVLELFQKDLSMVHKKVESIRIQRNKIYAHNDKDGLLSADKIISNNPISYDDLKKLIDLAQDILGVLHEALTGNGLPRSYSNIDDWGNTLQLAELGLKYQEHDCQLQQQELDKKLQGEIENTCNPSNK